MAFISQDKIFYGASAFLGILAILYFGFEYLVALSPFTISVMLFAIFAAFLGLGLDRSGNSSVLAYIFSAGAYVVGLFYTMSSFSFGSDGVMFSLAVSSAVFAGLGYLVTQMEFRPERDQLKYAAIILCVVVGGLIIYDASSDQVNYEYSLVDEVEVNDSMVLGEVTTEKPGLLPRESSSVRFQACAYNQTGAPRGSSGFSSSADTMRFGSLTQTEDIVVEMDVEELGFSGNVSVEEGSEGFRCVERGEGPAIVVASTDTDVPVMRYD